MYFIYSTSLTDVYGPIINIRFIDVERWFIYMAQAIKHTEHYIMLLDCALS